MEKKKNLMWLILLTLCLFVFIIQLISPYANKSAWPVVVILGLMVVCFWIVFIKKSSKSKRLSEAENNANIRDRKEPKDVFGSVKEQTRPEQESMNKQNQNKKDCQMSHDAAENSKVTVHCKKCGRQLTYIRNMPKQYNLVHLQSGTYCVDCFPKLFEPGNCEILFLIDAQYGHYTERIEFKDSTYYHVKEVIREASLPLGMWSERDTVTVTNQRIDYDTALSYAKTEEEIETLQTINNYLKVRMYNRYADSITYSSEGIHGDQIEIIKSGNSFCATAWNDGYPNKMAGGEYGSLHIPDSIVNDFSVGKLDELLQKHFGGNVSIVKVCSDQEMLRFFSKNKSAKTDGVMSENSIPQPTAEPERVKPAEIMELNNYFTRAIPSYLGDEELDGADDKTNINWLNLQGNDVVRSINKYIAFKPCVSSYKNLRLDWAADYILRAFHEMTTFFIVDSRNSLPKDEKSLESLKNISIKNSIRIVEKISKGIYHDYVEEKFYRLEVDETWWGSADDAATYGAYHIREITMNEALKK